MLLVFRIDRSQREAKGQRLLSREGVRNSCEGNYCLYYHWQAICTGKHCTCCFKFIGLRILRICIFSVGRPEFLRPTGIYSLATLTNFQRSTLLVGTASPEQRHTWIEIFSRGVGNVSFSLHQFNKSDCFVLHFVSHSLLVLLESDSAHSVGRVVTHESRDGASQVQTSATSHQRL